MNFRRLIKTGIRFLSKNKTPLLIGTGIVLGLGAAAETGRVAPVAKERIETRKKELGVEKLPVTETIKVAGPVYIPAILMEVGSVGCIIGGTAESMRSNAALAAACTLSENALQDYKQSVIETVGDKKEALIEENLAKNKVTNLPPASPTLMIPAPGDLRCIDTFTGMEFTGNASAVKQAVSELNYEMTTNDNYISLNEYLERIGVRSCNADFGEELGWSINDGVLKVQFTSALTADEVPCLAVTVNPRPHSGYLNY